jgi:hypothetical protein
MCDQITVEELIEFLNTVENKNSSFIVVDIEGEFSFASHMFVDADGDVVVW